MCSDFLAENTKRAAAFKTDCRYIVGILLLTCSASTIGVTLKSWLDVVQGR